jgi:hypothetical protein
MPIGVSPIAGWRLPGNYGSLLKPTMKPIIFSSVPSEVNRAKHMINLYI